MPGFQLCHPTYGSVELKVVGFWTPEDLREKAERLKAFGDHARIIFAVAESVGETIGDLGHPAVFYKTAIKPSEILALLETLYAD